MHILTTQHEERKDFKMKIDKEKLAALAALPDDALWREAVKMAAAYGFTLPEKTPPKETLDRLRSAVLGEKINVMDAARIIKKYRKETEK